MMETMVPTKEIKKGMNEFLDNGIFRVRILWKTNQQLFQSTYHQYDEIYRFQREQMIKDINSADAAVKDESSVFDKGPAGLSNKFSTDEEHKDREEVQGVGKHFRGRRISSLGDEIYYTFDSIEQNEKSTTESMSSSIPHQGSLESYQLNKEKMSKFREKQATMPGWDGLRPRGHHEIATTSNTASSSSFGYQEDYSDSHLHNHRETASPKLSNSFARLGSSSAKLNTIQVGLAAIFNPENYIQQQKKKIPFIPGVFIPPWLSSSHDEGLSVHHQQENNFEKTVSSPVLHSIDKEEETIKVSSFRRPRPSRLYGINKCQSLNC